MTNVSYVQDLVSSLPLIMPEPYDSLEDVGGIATLAICFPRLLSVRMSGHGGGALFCTNRGVERNTTGGPHYQHTPPKETQGWARRHTERCVQNQRVSHLKSTQPKQLPLPLSSSIITAENVTQDFFFKQMLQQINKVIKANKLIRSTF